MRPPFVQNWNATANGFLPYLSDQGVIDAIENYHDYSGLLRNGFPKVACFPAAPVLDVS